jgi:DNA-binding transcriptional LysR family regulator
MQGLDWNLLRSFVFVIKTGSLSAAARALEATQPTIGRHIESLEANLGIPLFVRSREGLSPTEEALNLFPEAQTMVSAYGAFIRRASGEDPAEIGSIRLAVSEIIGAEVLLGLLGEFRQQFPAVHLELSVSNRVDNLLKLLAITGSVFELMNSNTCPKSESGIALCYLSLMFSIGVIVLYAFYLKLPSAKASNRL